MLVPVSLYCIGTSSPQRRNAASVFLQECWDRKPCSNLSEQVSGELCTHHTRYGLVTGSSFFMPLLCVTDLLMFDTSERLSGYSFV